MEADPLHGMTYECPADFLTSLETLEAPLGHSIKDLSRAELKDLRPLGHEVSLWALAANRLISQANKNHFSSDLAAFLRKWLPHHVSVPHTGNFFLLLAQTTKGWQLAGSSLPWMRAPTWNALLKLPALRSFWISELRGSHFEHLQRCLPASWLMDPMPLPPGSVIAGLEISTWQELPDLQKQNRSFTIYSNKDTTNPSDLQPNTDGLIDLLKGIQSENAVLVEHLAPHSWLLARYETLEKHISLTGTWTSSTL